MSYVHGDADFVCFTGGWEPYEMICAQVEYEFPRNASKDEMIWKRISLPFKHYPELCNEPRYILTSFTTNKYPGEGDAGDEMFVDDLHLIYNPSLECIINNEQLTDYEIEIEYISAFIVRDDFRVRVIDRMDFCQDSKFSVFWKLESFRMWWNCLEANVNDWRSVWKK